MIDSQQNVLPHSRLLIAKSSVKTWGQHQLHHKFFYIGGLHHVVR